MRLFDRRQARWSDDAVHEKVSGRADRARSRATCCTNRREDLGRYLEKQNRYTTLAARSCTGADTARAWPISRFSPLARFLKFYLLRLGFLDGLPGLVHISIGCMNSFMKYAKLIDLRKADGR